MNPVARLAREIRFVRGLFRTLWRVRKIAPDSPVLICDDFEESVDKFADHTALVFEDDRLTYRDLDGLSNRFAAWGEAQGLQAGDTVALLLPNRTEYVPAWMGLAKIGIVTSRKLIGWWRYAFLLAFVVAAIVTPSIDPVTQTVVALPIIVLYFAGAGLARLVEGTSLLGSRT